MVAGAAADHSEKFVSVALSKSAKVHILTKMEKKLRECSQKVIEDALTKIRTSTGSSVVVLAPDIHREIIEKALESVLGKHTIAAIFGIRRINVVHIYDLMKSFTDWLVKYGSRSLVIDTWISGSGKALLVSGRAVERSMSEEVAIDLAHPASIAKMLTSSSKRVVREEVSALSDVRRDVLLKILREYILYDFGRFNDAAIIFDRVYDQKIDAEILKTIMDAIKRIESVTVVIPLNPLSIDDLKQPLELVLWYASSMKGPAVESVFERITFREYVHRIKELVGGYAAALVGAEKEGVSESTNQLSRVLQLVIKDSIAIAGASIEALYAADIIVRRLINAVASAEEPLPVEEAYERCVSSVANRVTTVIPDTARPLVGVVSRVVGLSPRVVASAMAGLGKVAVDQIENRRIAVVSPETLRRCAGGIAAVDDVARVLEAMSFLGLVTRVSEGSEEYVLGYTPPLIAALRAFRGM